MGNIENLVSSKQQGQPVHHTGLPGSMSSDPINLNLEGDSGNLIDLDRGGEGSSGNPIIFLEISSYFFFFCFLILYLPCPAIQALYTASKQGLHLYIMLRTSSHI